MQGSMRKLQGKDIKFGETFFLSAFKQVVMCRTTAGSDVIKLF